MAKTILTISGSTREESTNRRFLEAFANTFSQYDFEFYDIGPLPLFHPYTEQDNSNSDIDTWKEKLIHADAVIIATPAYLHNIPAALKSAMEWLASSGEFVGKPVLPITYTPAPTRGTKAMQSLLWSLQALDANIVTSLELHHSEVSIVNEKITNPDVKELLQGAIELLF